MGIELSADLSLDYTLNNPDTLTKYKTAAQISHRVLETVTGTNTSRSKILDHFVNHMSRMVRCGREDTVNM